MIAGRHRKFCGKDQPQRKLYSQHFPFWKSGVAAGSALLGAGCVALNNVGGRCFGPAAWGVLLLIVAFFGLRAVLAAARSSKKSDGSGGCGGGCGSFHSGDSSGDSGCGGGGCGGGGCS
jgi:hypothetical protein